MHLCYERPGLVSALNGYEKWDRERDRGGGPGSGGAGGSRAARDRDRERDRERERQARAHQMSHAHAAEPDASSLFPALVRVSGSNDRVSRQIQNKLGDYNMAQSLIDDPSKSIGICPEPPSPAPCPPRRESEFKKPGHAPQNGRVHRTYNSYKSEVPASMGTSAPRPPPLRIPNGYPHQNSIDSSQPPIEIILKEMISLPTPLTVIASTPRKESENKFIFNSVTNKVQENPQYSNDLKTPPLKPGLDNRISTSRNSVSPGVVKEKSLLLSESEDEVPPTTTGLEPLVFISPLGSAGSPSSSSSQSDSESESSSAESTVPPPAPVRQSPEPARPSPEQRQSPKQPSSWGLHNFAPPPAQTFADNGDLHEALEHFKKKPSPISDLSEDSGASSSSPGVRRRRSIANRVSTSDDDAPAGNNAPSSPPTTVTTGVKRGRPPKPRTEERPAKKKRGRPRKPRPEPAPAPPAPPPAALPAQLITDSKTHIFRKVFTPKKGDEGGGKGGKGGKGKGGKGKAKAQVTVIEVTAPEGDEERRRRDEALSRLSPPTDRHDRTDRKDPERTTRILTETTSNDRIPDRSLERTAHDRASERLPSDRLSHSDRSSERASSDRSSDRLSGASDRLSVERSSERPHDRHSTDKHERMSVDKPHERLSDKHDRSDKSDRLSGENMAKMERLSTESMSKMDRLSTESISKIDRLSTENMAKIERLSTESMSKLDRLSGDKLDRLPEDKLDKLPGDKLLGERFVRAEADVGSGVKSERTERLEEACSNLVERRCRARVVVRVPLARLSDAAQRRVRRRPAPHRAPQSGEVAATNHERTASGQTPIYYSYFERLPADTLSDEERDHQYYLGEATALRIAAEREHNPLARVMLYLESVLCFVLTGRVLELEADTKRAFTIYRETIEYIKSIHSMPQRFRASPHSTFSKLDILSLRVQALLYLRMFKMYNREVKEYYKIVQEYQQKPACAESVSPSPSPAGSAHSAGSASSACYPYTHAVPAATHHALLQLTKYYTFLYVAHDLWEQADCLCRLRSNLDLFIAVDRKCGPLTLFSSFRHLVQYVRHAISLLKNAPRD